MKSKRIAFIVAVCVFALDVLTKHLVINYILPGTKIVLIGGYLDLINVMNPGVAFGMLSEVNSIWRDVFLYGAAVVATVLLGGMYSKLPKDAISPSLAIGLLWGGIAGNILDRVRFGAVVDFVSVHIKDASWAGEVFGKSFNIPLSWPAFNVADSAITIAVIVLLIAVMRGKI